MINAFEINNSFYFYFFYYKKKIALYTNLHLVQEKYLACDIQKIIQIYRIVTILIMDPIKFRIIKNFNVYFHIIETLTPVQKLVSSIKIIRRIMRAIV